MTGGTPAEPYFDDGQVTLHLGDCLSVLPSLPDESAGIVVTSPPYNMGLQPGGGGRGMYAPGAGANNKGGRFAGGYGGHRDAMPYAGYCEWQRRVLAECWRVARLGIFYNHRPRVEHGKLRMPLDFDFGGLPVRQVITWDRGTGIDVNLRHFCTRQEWIIVFAKPAFRLVSHAASGMGDVWRLGMETRVPGHPARSPWHCRPAASRRPARKASSTRSPEAAPPFSPLATPASPVPASTTGSPTASLPFSVTGANGRCLAGACR